MLDLVDFILELLDDGYWLADANPLNRYWGKFPAPEEVGR